MRAGMPLAALRVEVAGNRWRRARGLMGRRGLGEDEGLLLAYPRPRVVRVWMAGVPMALDLLFIDAQGRVVRIARSLRPGSLRWTSSGTAVSGVLELVAGTAERTGIAVGDFVAVHRDGNV